jgi:hypothetical protein
MDSIQGKPLTSEAKKVEDEFWADDLQFDSQEIG